MSYDRPSINRFESDRAATCSVKSRRSVFSFSPQLTCAFRKAVGCRLNVSLIQQLTVTPHGCYTDNVHGRCCLVVVDVEQVPASSENYRKTSAESSLDRQQLESSFVDRRRRPPAAPRAANGTKAARRSNSNNNNKITSADEGKQKIECFSFDAQY
jgi:hypothetical protein